MIVPLYSFICASLVLIATVCFRIHPEFISRTISFDVAILIF